MKQAVVLMAYGSPDRIEDVPAYYADIRGGGPVRPELLADLTERYRRLGIEESNPLNEITERTRAALEAELGLPVFTGMKHWRPRIADAAEAALGTGPDTVVGLVLAPHYSRLSIGGYRQQLEDALAGLPLLRQRTAASVAALSLVRRAPVSGSKKWKRRTSTARSI